MNFQRSSGVLLHISSLPSYGGIGDLGPAAHDFLDFLANAHQHIWQVLPLCPTGYGNSPYAGSSAFAGNPSLISLEFLADWGWIDGSRISGLPGRSGYVGFDALEHNKLPLLYQAARNFLDRAPFTTAAQSPLLADQWSAFRDFCTTEAHWLDDYALYAVLRRHYNTGAWVSWPESLRRRHPESLAEARRTFAKSIAEEQALQFAFDLQWRLLRTIAQQKKIRILGDVAIFVNMDSADVWVHPELFELDADLQPIRIAGVPPDYFSPTGQRWGNPLYRWELLAKTNYAWWIERIRRATTLYDLVRLDHFRGFESYWAIPAAEETAVNGEWVKAPGAELFHALESALGPLPLIAEDLGIITEAVDELRISLNMPGMRVLQFGFGSLDAHNHLPHLYEPSTVAYTGTHDNDTTQGWWNSASTDERQAVETYLGPVLSHPVWPLIRAANSSVAQLALAPAQDLLELGSESRMNTPAVPSGNWSWRAPEGSFTPSLAHALANIVTMTDRDNDPLAQPKEKNQPESFPH